MIRQKNKEFERVLHLFKWHYLADIFCLGIGGRQGAHLWVPSAEFIDVDGPILGEKKAYYAFNGFLHAQMIYGSPRCVAKAASTIIVAA